MTTPGTNPASTDDPQTVEFYFRYEPETQPGDIVVTAATSSGSVTYQLEFSDPDEVADRCDAEASA